MSSVNFSINFPYARKGNSPPYRYDRARLPLSTTPTSTFKAVSRKRPVPRAAKPDGGKIAFWLADGQGNKTLIIANAATGDVVNYCILNLGATKFSRGLSATIRSPDRKYLLVENRYSPDNSKLPMVDLLNNIAFPIAENVNPVGGMIKP